MATKTIPITLDIPDYEEVTAIKEATGKSWEGFFMIAVRTYKTVSEGVN